MASIITLKDRKTGKPNGHRAIQFVDMHGNRPTVRLGKCPQKLAESYLSRIEALNECVKAGRAPDTDLMQWLTARGTKFLKRLESAGLIEKREAATLEAFLESYIAKRTDIKPSTEICLRQTKKNLVEFFGADKRLLDVTSGDADEFRLYLANDAELGEHTIRRRCGRAKQFFAAALKRRLITENPFADMKRCTVGANRDRDFFVTREMAQRVIDACPSAEWRLIFALSRFAGLRCPSEHAELKWSDIDWQRNRMVVRSPKTSHHDGKESRIVPIFAELRPFLEDAFDPESVYVISRRNHSAVNLRTQFMRIIKRAGLKPWPKVFHNLRATRQTELAASYPIHVVCDWIGNSVKVATRHYLRTTEEEFDRATQTVTASEMAPQKSNAQSNAVNVQKAMQHAATLKAGNSQENESGLENSAERQALRVAEETKRLVNKCKVARAGLERKSLSTLQGNNLRQSPEAEHAKSNAHSSPQRQSAPAEDETANRRAELDVLTAAWPHLSPQARRRILGIVLSCDRKQRS